MTVVLITQVYGEGRIVSRRLSNAVSDLQDSVGARRGDVLRDGDRALRPLLRKLPVPGVELPNMTDDTEDTRGPKERAYDEHIDPLMSQIRDLCEAHKINFFGTFSLDPTGSEEHGGSSLRCTTAMYLDPEDQDGVYLVKNLVHVARDGWAPRPQTLAFSVSPQGGGGLKE
jgi:hypothetical protein